MKYFLDTEFIEGFKKPIKWLPTLGRFNKPYHSIQLISIGIKCEDGSGYYGISNEFNPNDANEWVKENVLAKLAGSYCNRKSLAAIKLDILSYFRCFEESGGLYYRTNEQIELYGYYADYDWVVFCSLFGTMTDLPKGFPMYCRDLKQMFDSIQESTPNVQRLSWHEMEERGLKEQDVFKIKLMATYPKQTNEHNALDDATWNFELYKFLKNLSK